ncbi:hypothetical protein Hanom_Chr10g00965261 [Helianthus anomalus]
MIIGKLNEQCQRPPVHSAYMKRWVVLWWHLMCVPRCFLHMEDKERSEKICDTVDREAGWGASTSPAAETVVKPSEWVRTRCRVLWQ